MSTLKQLFILCLVGAELANAASLSSDIPIQDELSQLEALHKQGAMKEESRIRLAEIYFLTSRCNDVKKFLQHEESALTCACGGACKKDSIGYRLMSFRHSLVKGKPWKDKGVQKLWSELKDVPEAKYWALKALGQDSQLRQELEKSLEGYEVTVTK